MIDFLSTRPGASPQDKACAALLACVIAEAITDASEPLRAEERQEQRNISPRAREALRFLFERGRPFEAYARLIGADAAALRRRMLLPAEDNRSFPEHRRRNLRARYDLSDFFISGVEPTTRSTNT